MTDVLISQNLDQDICLQTKGKIDDAGKPYGKLPLDFQEITSEVRKLTLCFHFPAADLN